MKEHLKLIGKKIEKYIGGLVVEVKILDVRERFGRVDILVTPVKGSGEKWVTY